MLEFDSTQNLITDNVLSINKIKDISFFVLLYYIIKMLFQ